MKLTPEIVIIPLELLKQQLDRILHRQAKAGGMGIGGSYIAGPATGIAGAIVCEDGTTYLLSDDPKTDM